MNRLVFSMVMVATIGSACPAVAQDTQLYAGAGVDSVGANFLGVSGRLGYDFNSYFGVEAQLGSGVIGDGETFNGFDVDADVKVYGAAYGNFRYPVSPSFHIIGRAGYHFFDLEVEAESNSDTSTADGVALGLGGQYNFGRDDKNGIRLEYTYLDIQNGENTDRLSLAYIRRF